MMTMTIYKYVKAYMRLEPPSPQCHFCDSPLRASHPAGRRTCGLSGYPIQPHAERTRTDQDLKKYKIKTEAAHTHTSEEVGLSSTTPNNH